VFCGEYAEQTAEARANFRATLNILTAQPTIEGWCRPNGFDRLAGKKHKPYRELGKLRFKTRDAAHRPLGFFGPYSGAFTLLIWATERDGDFWPPSVLDTALQRMKAVKQNPGLANACNL